MVPGSSTSVTETVTATDPDRLPPSLSSVAVTFTWRVEPASKLGGAEKYSWPRSEIQKSSLSTDQATWSRSGSLAE